MTTKPTPLKPIQTAAASVNPTPAPQLPETGFLRLNQIIRDDTHPPIIPLANHPLINSVPFGGSFGIFELEDDKW